MYYTVALSPITLLIAKRENMSSKRIHHDVLRLNFVACGIKKRGNEADCIVVELGAVKNNVMHVIVEYYIPNFFFMQSIK